MLGGVAWVPGDSVKRLELDRLGGVAWEGVVPGQCEPNPQGGGRAGGAFFDRDESFELRVRERR